MLEFIVTLLAIAAYAFYFDLNLVEAPLVIVAILVAKRSKFGAAAANRAWKALFRLAQRPKLAVASVFVIALVARAILLPVLPVPEPVITDEFSHLLVGDTLAHGRLTNPTHPEWQHFESIHILQKPTYNSDYFPGQGAVLALGERLGHPWIGVWLLCAAMCAALFWMLEAWVSPVWALFGALIAILRFDIASYWVNGYYGGCLAAAGGALALGAYPRLLKNPRWFTSCVGGLGIVIIGFTRPFEGLAVAVPVAIALVVAIARKRARLWVAFPAATVIGAGVAFLLIYDRAVTGDPFTPPYAVNQATYGWPMTLPWFHPPEVQFRHVELQRYYDYERDVHDHNAIAFRARTLEELWRFYFGPALSVPLIVLPSMWKTRRFRLPLMAAALTVLATLIEVGSSPHYAAAATGSFLLVTVVCFRRLCGRRWGAQYALLAPIILIVILAARIGLEKAHLPFSQGVNYESWCCVQPGGPAKARIVRMLDGIDGRHLVVVKPKTDPNNVFQWIYNDADIDSAKIVWARDMGPKENESLLSHFRERKIWVLDPNLNPPQIVHWTGH